MKRRDSLPLISLLLLAFIVAGIASSTTIPAFGARGHAKSQSASPSALEERIKRVENDLLPPFVIKGQPSAPMKLADRMKYYNTPGISIAVIDKGRVEWARGYGVRETGGSEAVTPETVFQAASISKPVAAMAALRLVQQGKLNLDEDVNRKLTSWKLPENEFTSEKKVTVRELLSHNAGLTVHGFEGYASDACTESRVVAEQFAHRHFLFTRELI